MNTSSLRGVLAPSKSYVCLYCRLDYITSTVHRIRRYQHTTSQRVENVANSVPTDNAFNKLGENFNSDPKRRGTDLPPTLERFGASTDVDDRSLEIGSNALIPAAGTKKLRRQKLSQLLLGPKTRKSQTPKPLENDQNYQRSPLADHSNEISEIKATGKGSGTNARSKVKVGRKGKRNAKMELTTISPKSTKKAQAKKRKPSTRAQAAKEKPSSSAKPASKGSKLPAKCPREGERKSRGKEERRKNQTKDDKAQPYREVETSVPASKSGLSPGTKVKKKHIGKAIQEKPNLIESVTAQKLQIAAINVEQPPVPSLSYGLERVLFNPGVYQLQDPRSRVFNFDPYLQSIMPVEEFDFPALKEYITSSKDKSLKTIADAHGKRYVGSSSSMTGVLAHFHFLLSQWRPVNDRMLSKGFPESCTSFTGIQKSPAAIFLRWKEGSYAIDADKEFDSASVLTMLGKSMEKLLTLDREDFERYRKSNPVQVSQKESNAPEAYHYSAMGDFLMRSQLDAYDPRLPGSGMFDLKTRAVVSIRMSSRNHQHGVGYQIKSSLGKWESFEREYYDMIRAAFLKYSLQVRMGRMDGIFVAYHNVERIFGFQYISLPEMDQAIHGRFDTTVGDQEFKLSLDLLNKVLNKATQKFPERSLRIHVENRDTQLGFMYIFVEPVTEAQVEEIQARSSEKIKEFERNLLGLHGGVQSSTARLEDDASDWADLQDSVQEAMVRDELDLVKDEEGRVLIDTEREARDEEDIAASGDDTSDKVDMEDGRHDAKYRKDDVEAMEKNRQERDIDSGQLEDRERETTERKTDEDKEKSRPEPSTGNGGERGDADNNTYAEVIGVAEDSQQARKDEMASNPSDALDNHQQDAQLEATRADAIELSEERVDAQTLSLPKNTGREQETPVLATKEKVLLEQGELLAMTLAIRNKVNAEYVTRPDILTTSDTWTVEYSLSEIKHADQAWDLYRACQKRRMKKLVPDEDEEISRYIQELREMSQRGGIWRRVMDEGDKLRPPTVLGQKLPKERGPGVDVKEFRDLVFGR